MSAILSADDLNDFISPSVACIKPVETLPDPPPSNAYEVTTEDKVEQQQRTAQISLTDCLACSGCVTSAEAVLVSLQSHAEVLSALDSAPPFPVLEAGDEGYVGGESQHGKVFVASISPQVRASLAATYNVTEKEAGYMIEQLLSGPDGLARGGKYGNRFTWVIDTNVARDLVLATSSEEVANACKDGNQSSASDISSPAKLPVLTSACPGWICYAEKTHPHVLPHISKLKSPQALAGTMIKTVLSYNYQIDPAQIFHLAVMPCFDKKLEASRQELTDVAWRDGIVPGAPIRDVDCVITAREVLMLADSRGLCFKDVPRTAIKENVAFPDPLLNDFLFESRAYSSTSEETAGTSGGYLYQIIKLCQGRHPGSTISIERGRNADVIEYSVRQGDALIFKGARYYGFRNIQNLVRKLKPARAGRAFPLRKALAAGGASKPSSKNIEHSYIEVMACPGGCTNGGGQIKLSDLSDLQSSASAEATQKEWLSRVDEAYFSSSDLDASERQASGETFQPSLEASMMRAKEVLGHWSEITGIQQEKLTRTTYREVESDVGKDRPDTERVAALAGKIGGGW